MTFNRQLCIIFIFTSISSSVFSKTWGGKINPIYSLIGVQDFAIDLDGGIKRRLTISGLYANLDMVDIDIKGYGFGAHYTFHTNEIFEDGWFIGPALGYGNLEYEDAAKDEIGDVEFIAFGGIGGYQICWSDFYVEFTGKYGVFLESEFKVKNNKSGESQEDEFSHSLFLLDFKVGFIF